MILMLYCWNQYRFDWAREEWWAVILNDIDAFLLASKSIWWDGLLAANDEWVMQAVRWQSLAGTGVGLVGRGVILINPLRPARLKKPRRS